MNYQYTLSLNHPNTYNVHDFIFTSCNNSLYALINCEDDFWGVGKYNGVALVVGGSKSGKTHFAHMILDKFHAKLLTSSSKIADLDISNCSTYIIEDIDIGWDEERLLHLFNYLHENHKKVLLTCKRYNNFTLPDLQSRILSVDIRKIKDPDDDMIKSLLQKKLIECSINVSEDVILFLSHRIGRNFKSICDAVEVIDRLSLEQKRNITVPFLSSISIY